MTETLTPKIEVFFLNMKAVTKKILVVPMDAACVTTYCVWYKVS